MQTEKFLDQMKTKHITTEDLAALLHTNPMVIRHKIASGSWDTVELQQIQSVLQFPNPSSIFFS